MKRFQDLFIELGDVTEDEFILALTECCRDPWRRDQSVEQPLPAGVNYYCFEVEETPELRKSLLVIARNQRPRTYSVSNIVPKDKAKLTFDEYNTILRDFVNSTLVCASQQILVEYELTQDTLSEEEVFGSEAAELLQLFSSAHAGDYGSRPLDRDRWFDFIVAAHTSRSRHKKNIDLLEQTLLEQGWAEDQARALSTEYEFALDLLDYSKGGQMLDSALSGANKVG